MQMTISTAVVVVKRLQPVAIIWAPGVISSERVLCILCMDPFVSVISRACLFFREHKTVSDCVEAGACRCIPVSMKITLDRTYVAGSFSSFLSIMCAILES